MRHRTPNDERMAEAGDIAYVALSDCGRRLVKRAAVDC